MSKVNAAGRTRAEQRDFQRRLEWCRECSHHRKLHKGIRSDCWKWIGDEYNAAGVAVGLSCRCSAFQAGGTPPPRRGLRRVLFGP